MKRRRKKSKISLRHLLGILLFIVIVGGITYYFIRPEPSSIELQPLPEGFYSHGIDVSHHQGEIDWDTFFEQMDTTISFVYYKVTEGSHFVDEHWQRNHRALENQGMKHGGYHFFTPDISASLQAYHFLKQFAIHEMDLPPVLDAETEASTDKRLIEGMKEWLTIVEARTRIRPMIYTSYSLYRDKMRGKFPGYSFWIASYNMDATRLEDPEIIHWQYSDRGKIPGIQELVDLNFSKTRFAEPIEFAQ